MKLPRLRWLLALALLAAAIGIYLSDHLLFELPDEQVRHYHRKMSERLERRQDIHVLIDDGAIFPTEWITQAPLNIARALKSRHGNRTGWKFTGHGRSYIETHQNWADVGDQFTISTWIHPQKHPHAQPLLFTNAHGGKIGLRLEHDHLVFYIPPNDQTLQYPFSNFENPTHIAAVADAKSGVASLYENGVLMASEPIEAVVPPEHPIDIGRSRWYADDMLLATVFDTAVFRRALPPDEIRRLANTSSSLARKLEPNYHRRLRLAQSTRRILRSTLKTVDYFNLRLHAPKASNADLPRIDLYFSDSDRRFFNAAHAENLQNARRTTDGAESRSIHYATGDTPTPARLRLLGPYENPDPSARMGFLLETDTPDEVLQSSFIRLQPPEQAGYLLPLLESRIADSLNLPSIHNGLCRLFINGVFTGVYLYEDFQTQGIFPGNATDLFAGPVHPADWRTNLRTRSPDLLLRVPFERQLPLSSSQLHDLYQSLEDDYNDPLLHDMRNPVSARERRYRFSQTRQNLPDTFDLAETEHDQLLTAHEILNEFMLAPQNPSPHYLIEDLDLAIFPNSPFSISWASSDPSLLSPSGALTRPESGPPRSVTLTATLSQNDISLEKDLEFRVISRENPMKTFMIHAREPLTKISRVDAIAHIHLPGDHPQPLTKTAFQDTRGGVAHRGNTGHWRDKKPLNLRFDQPHGLIDESDPTLTIHFATGYVEPTFMRNRLTYDTFRSFSSEGDPRFAAALDWAEVFVNGSYHGLYEANTPVSASMLDFPSFDSDDPSPPVLYKVESLAWAFEDDNPKSVQQRRPRLRRVDTRSDFLDLVSFIRDSDSHTFQQNYNQWFDTDNAVDFHIMVNLIQGIDNLTQNFFLYRNLHGDPRFSFIFHDGNRGFNRHTSHWFTNRLLHRLEQEVPEFTDRLHHRWKELRAHDLSPETMIELVDQWAEHLDGYIQHEYRLWSLNQDASFQEHVDLLKQRISERFEFLDAEIPRRYESIVGD